MTSKAKALSVAVFVSTGIFLIFWSVFAVWLVRSYKNPEFSYILSNSHAFGYAVQWICSAAFLHAPHIFVFFQYYRSSNIATILEAGSPTHNVFIFLNTMASLAFICPILQVVPYLSASIGISLVTIAASYLLSLQFYPYTMCISGILVSVALSVSSFAHLKEEFFDAFNKKKIISISIFTAIYCIAAHILFGIYLNAIISSEMVKEPQEDDEFKEA